MEDYKKNEREEVYSKVVKAGKRTYFFDVKATRGDDYYVTITESKKKVGDNGDFYFTKHKIFLYKEDFEKFQDGLNEVVKYVVERRGTSTEQSNNHSSNGDSFSNVNFEDLGKEESKEE